MIKKEEIKKRILKTNNYRKGVRLIVYKKEKNNILYLVLKRKLRWIGYETPKGGKLNSESDIKAITRELKEETSLKPKKIIPLNIKEKFNYPKKHQEVFNKKGMISNCYLIEGIGKIKLSKEHSSYKWLDYKKALSLLTYSNQKKILKKSNKILNKK